MKLKIINVADPLNFNNTFKISDNTDLIYCVGITCFSGEPYDNSD